MPLAVLTTYEDSPTLSTNQVCEKWVLLNVYHMLLGIPTDLFKINPSSGVVAVNSNPQVFVSHISSAALKSVLKEVALVGSITNLVRCCLDNTSAENRIVALFCNEFLLSHMKTFENHIQSMIVNLQSKNHYYSLIDTLADLQRQIGSVRECGKFISVVNAKHWRNNVLVEEVIQRRQDPKYSPFAYPAVSFEVLLNQFLDWICNLTFHSIVDRENGNQLLLPLIVQYVNESQLCELFGLIDLINELRNFHLCGDENIPDQANFTNVSHVSEKLSKKMLDLFLQLSKFDQVLWEMKEILFCANCSFILEFFTLSEHLLNSPVATAIEYELVTAFNRAFEKRTVLDPSIAPLVKFTHLEISARKSAVISSESIRFRLDISNSIASALFTTAIIKSINFVHKSMMKLCYANFRINRCWTQIKSIRGTDVSMLLFTRAEISKRLTTLMQFVFVNLIRTEFESFHAMEINSLSMFRDAFSGFVARLESRIRQLADHSDRIVKISYKLCDLIQNPSLSLQLLLQVSLIYKEVSTYPQLIVED